MKALKNYTEKMRSSYKYLKTNLEHAWLHCREIPSLMTL